MESPSQSPKGAPNLASKRQDGVSRSTREAEIPDLDPDSLPKDNKKTHKMPRPPKDEQPDEDEEFQPDWSEDEGPARVGAGKGDVFTIKEETVIDGKIRLTERKARFCVHCNA